MLVPFKAGRTLTVFVFPSRRRAMLPPTLSLRVPSEGRVPQSASCYATADPVPSSPARRPLYPP
jgi:hypothetical protein